MLYANLQICKTKSIRVNIIQLLLKAAKTYLSVICHKKLLCGEKMRSGKNIIVRMKAHSKTEIGYLWKSGEVITLLEFSQTYSQALRPNIHTKIIMLKRSVK